MDGEEATGCVLVSLDLHTTKHNTTNSAARLPMEAGTQDTAGGAVWKDITELT